MNNTHDNSLVQQYVTVAGQGSNNLQVTHPQVGQPSWSSYGTSVVPTPVNFLQDPLAASGAGSAAYPHASQINTCSGTNYISAGANQSGVVEGFAPAAPSLQPALFTGAHNNMYGAYSSTYEPVGCVRYSGVYSQEYDYGERGYQSPQIPVVMPGNSTGAPQVTYIGLTH